MLRPGAGVASLPIRQPVIRVRLVSVLLRLEKISEDILDSGVDGKHRVV